ncbi:hypothetical protein [Cytobacillus dafuensis]|uniref:Coupling factor for flagellin transcription and translation n=1 Tax=Cytobacillus dafuensis TaxID=1742359 RepID=A0A5B8Z7E2_CYTDA|nr:hypothetical protein [Cytobacillus dafuensis]QED47569.1 hypothetical protein FSZ17_10025 [Cytobacillus dafuensis]
MTTFFIFFSIFLNIIALFAIIILFLRQNRILEVEKKQEKMFLEMEEVISSYLVQMKEDNEDFIKRLNKIDLQSTHSSFTEKNNSDKNEEKNVDHNSFQTRIGKASVYSAANAYKQNAKTSILRHDHEHPPLSDQTVELPSYEINTNKELGNLIINNSSNDFQEQSLLSQVLHLKEQGYSEEAIAQKLNKGKTEIALLLKFNQKNEE